MTNRDSLVGTTAKDYLGPANPTWGIFIISVFGLFLEMLLIRWIGTEVRIFAYLQNNVLVVCFLGLGLGCFTCRQPIKWRKMLFMIVLLVALIAFPLTRHGLGKIPSFLSVLEDFLIWDNLVAFDFQSTVTSVVVGLCGTYVLMLIVLDIFVPIGRLLGRLMDDHPHTIWAYSVNVGGSLIGTWLFVMLSVMFQPPLTWFLVLGVLACFFIDWKNRGWQINALLVVGIISLAWLAGHENKAREVIWSPYQKLVMLDSDPRDDDIGKYVVKVNNSGYQAMINLSESFTRAHPDVYSPNMLGLSQYDLPFLFHPSPKTALIVGAGTGNDAAGALRQGIKEVTAVEIDPAIIFLGRHHHPEQPYSSPGVEIVTDDARSFFAVTDKKYDIISFGLLDSHTTTAMTNARLDHYVYTRESIVRAKSLLADGGIMVLSFEAQKPFIADRMGRVLKEVFGQNPLSFRVSRSAYGWGGVIFVTGDLAIVNQQLAKNSRLAAFIEQMQLKNPTPLTFTANVATDDWPYIYLQTPSIPLLYFLLAVLMVILLIRSYYHWNATGLISRWRLSHWHFFFLGAAFLLLEVQNISKASVVLGNTWEVNAVIVSGVLAMILVANLLAYQFPRLPLGLVYPLLIATCLSLYFLDLAQFAFLPYATKAIIVGGLTTLPMLFSGIVFIRSFAVVHNKDEALGANLIGALVGALLQSVTFVTGIKALLLIVAGFYVLSLLTKPAFHDAA